MRLSILLTSPTIAELTDVRSQFVSSPELQERGISTAFKPSKPPSLQASFCSLQ